MNDEQEMRAKAIELNLNVKSRLLSAAIIANRSASGEWFDEMLDEIHTYIATGEKPKKKEKDD